MLLNRLQRRPAERIKSLYRDGLRAGRYSFNSSLRLNWNRFLFILTSTELWLFLFFAHGLQITLHYTVGLGDYTDSELFSILGLRFVFGITSILLANFLVLMTVEMTLPIARQQQIVPAMIVAFILVLTVTGVVPSFYVGAWLDVYHFDLPRELLFKTMTNAVAFTVIFSHFGSTLSFYQYAKLVATPELLDRLPVEKRGRLVLLQAREKKVWVKTTKGEAELSMNIGTAIDMCAPINGTRVHRSFWVAKDYLAPVYKNDRRWFMNVEGITVSVSAKVAKNDECVYSS